MYGSLEELELTWNQPGFVQVEVQAQSTNHYIVFLLYQQNHEDCHVVSHLLGTQASVNRQLVVSDQRH